MSKDWDIDTLAVRAGTARSQFNEHSEAMFLTSSFVFDNAAQAAARFSGSEPGNVYSRFTNPTVTMFEQRLAALEGGEACLATASGMSAILATCMATMAAGDHIVSSQSIFGTTVNLFNVILGRFGLKTSFVSLSDPAQWEAAIQPTTKMFYVETPSNPLMEVADLTALSAIAKRHGILLVVDNCFCTPALQRPFEFGADVIIHSATKYLDGQGRVLGGAVVGSEKFIHDTMLPFLRTAGPTLSAFNAWIFLKGLETLSLRMERQSSSALALARWLEQQPRVKRVYYPGLESHPQHAIAQRQQKSGGAIVSFEVEGGRAAAWTLIDQTRLCSITANLGDTKTTITHPASTTHARITPEARAAAGITEDLIRLAVGLEAIDDLQTDLQGGVR